MVTLLIATRNAHKVGEIRAILGDQFVYLTLNDLPEAPEVVEDAGTFAGNATKKAVAIASWAATKVRSPKSEIRNPKSRHKGQHPASSIQHPVSAPDFVLADDSGLEVDALGGAPGVHSARFTALDTGASGNSTAAENNIKLLRLLNGLPLAQRGARFRCVLALTPVAPAQPEASSPVCYANELELQTELFEGICEGRIELEPKGLRGFGYDPLFVPHGYQQTFGELSEEVKNRLSHRAQALQKLAEWLKSKAHKAHKD